MEEKIPRNMKSTSADQGTLLKGTWFDKKERAKEDGMETDLCLRETKSRWKISTPTNFETFIHTQYIHIQRYSFKLT
jgi:hypothetical protein